MTCKSQHAIVKDPNQLSGQKSNPADSAIIAIYQGACYGRCPDYTMTIYSNGRARYEGRHFVSKTGIYEKYLGADTLNDLENQFEQAGIWNMKTQYPSLASDLPLTRVTFNHNGKTISINGTYNAPQSLQYIVKVLYDISNSEGWKKIAELPARK